MESDRGMGNEKVDARLKVSQAHQCAYRTAVLRLALLEQLGGHDAVQWGHNWSILRKQREGVELSFGRWRGQNAKADLVVGADGIRSSVRKILIGDDIPLRYLDCIVILGICLERSRRC
jgi:2-polyprenyl-6-methoxyphenol hydroxylase-like FAD-dependent oxidoreductase